MRASTRATVVCVHSRARPGVGTARATARERWLPIRQSRPPQALCLQGQLMRSTVCLLPAFLDGSSGVGSFRRVTPCRALLRRPAPPLSGTDQLAILLRHRGVTPDRRSPEDAAGGQYYFQRCLLDLARECIGGDLTATLLPWASMSCLVEAWAEVERTAGISICVERMSSRP